MKNFFHSPTWLGAFLLLTLPSCGGVGTKSNSTTPTAPPAVATYADVDLVLTDKCAACHNDADHAPHFIGHEDALKANAQAVYTSLTTTDPKLSMPKARKTTAPLTDAQKQTIVTYSKKPDASFTTAVEPILEANCATCHADAARAKPHFVGHKDVFDANLTAIVAAVTTTDKGKVMPPAPSVPLTDDEKAKVLPYLQAQGAK